jgi:hypothetical protein
MKRQLIKICIVSLSLFFAACLDDDKNPLDPAGSSNVIEFLDIAVPASSQTAVHPLWVVSFGVSPEAEFNLILSSSGANSNDKDIEVTLEVDPLMIDAYNEQNDTHYEVLEDDLYSMASMTVTIPKGSKQVEIPVTVFPDQFDLSVNYALPLRIVSSTSGVISKNFGAALFGTVVKNKFDGEYEILAGDGSMVETTNPNFVGYYPKNSIYLSTVNGNTVNYSDNEYGADHIFYTGTGLSQWGGFGAQFAFSLTDVDEGGGTTSNAVTSVVNKYGQGNNNRRALLDVSGGAVNKMFFNADGTPNRLEVWYIMYQINGCACNRAIWKEKFTYVGPRP